MKIKNPRDNRNYKNENDNDSICSSSMPAMPARALKQLIAN